MTMQGPHKAKEFVNLYLESDLPDRLIKYRNAWNLDDEELPEPKKYLAYEPVAIDAWPTLITVAISMDGLERTDYTRLYDPRFSVAYTMRTYIWVKDDQSDLATLKRDRLITVLRSAILDGPSLNQCGDSEGLEVMIDESSIREEYSELTLIKGERVMAGAYLGYTVTIVETSRIPVIAPSATSIETEVVDVAIQETFDNI
jgi:hypothetical protein